jgi:tetratricopeptide (TPR) repeat protein
MKFIYSGLFLLFVLLAPLYVFGIQNVTAADTAKVIKLNKDAYKARLSEAGQTVALAQKALNLATQLKYNTGIAEAYRTIGIGYSYQYEQVKAYDNYLNALQVFQADNNSLGIAKVYNNIGNLYRDNDNTYDKALTYFKKAMLIAPKAKDNSLIAQINLNIGNVYLRKKDFVEALAKFNQSRIMFEKTNDYPNLMNSLQNIGVAYFNLHQFDKARELLLQANAGAKKLENNTAIASIDMTLADLFIAQSKFDEAEKYIQEGTSNAQNNKVEADFQYTYYQLEFKRQNYKQALYYLTKIYKQDSLDYKNYVSQRIVLSDMQHQQEARLQQNQITIERQKNQKYLLWGSAVAAGLLLVVIVLLVANVKRKAETNKRLTELNGEVSRQKDNLDRINHHLEEIIDERTKDLQIKNKKLSEYSSYLSHQIRGPIATLKGLMNLEKEGLVDKKECISMMDKCVSEIDDKIINMSDMLHDPDRAGF